MHKLAAKAASNAKPETKPYNLSDGGGLNSRLNMRLFLIVNTPFEW